MRSLKHVNSARIAILENENLCFADTINWKKLMKSSSHSILLQSNGNKEMCGNYKFGC